ncbi:MAG: sugar O-acetyltransferase [Bacteroidaceae bacterium]|nr:sugar O-acetyltransferase [Bacteroidaceae bacterium]
MNNTPIHSPEYGKMLAGETYQATEPGLVLELNRVKVLCHEYNGLCPTDFTGRNRKLHEILGQCHDDTFIVQPFYCDFGRHIRVGKGFFANFSFTVLDEAFVTIGNDCFIGPNVGIYTACHSTDPVERNTRREWARPVNIGDNCWIGGGVTILPGVSIGCNCTIGAGSVVVGNIPDNSVAVGNPCRVVRTL